MQRTLFVILLTLASLATRADQLVRVTADRLNVRSAPSTSASIVAQVDKGDQLSVVPVTNGWARISVPRKGHGFVSRRYLAPVGNRTSGFEHRSTNEPDGTGGGILILLVVGALYLFLKSASFKGRVGEAKVNVLTNVGLSRSTYNLIPDVTIRISPSDTTQIDQIIVSKYGVFVVETKNKTGWIFGGESLRTWTQG